MLGGGLAWGSSRESLPSAHLPAGPKVAPKYLPTTRRDIGCPPPGLSFPGDVETEGEQLTETKAISFCS